MQDNTIEIADVISNLDIEYGDCASCRGMLAVPPQGRGSGMHGPVAGGGGVDHVPARGPPGGIGNAGVADEAGTSRGVGPVGERNGGGASTSDAE